MRWILWTVMSASALAAEPVTPTAEAPAPETPEAPAEAAEAPRPGPVQRTYVMRSTFTSQMKDPNPMSRGGWISTPTFTWSVLDWKQTGTRVEYVETTCGVATTKVFGAETVYRKAFIAAVPKRRVIASLSSTSPGAMFGAGPYAQQFGVSLDDPYNDPLPTDKDDPHMVDADKDGHPGVTVEIYHPMVGRGEVYIAQRSVVRLEGEIDDKGVVRGFVRTAPNMFKADANRWFLRGDTPQRPHPNPDLSPFIMKPMADGTTCADVMAHTEDWFPKSAYDMH